MAEKEKYFLSVIIPAYNEENKIEKDLRMARDYFSKQPYTFEIIVVNDGSGDGTEEVLRGLQGEYPQIKVISYKENRGKGHAVQTGVFESRSEFILFADAGGCVPYECVQGGLEILGNQCDMAIGSRTLPASEIAARQSLHRRLGGALFWVVIRFFLGIKGIRDTQCGFKLFRREAAMKIFSRQRINGFMFDAECILNAKKFGFRIKEFPVRWTNDGDSRFHVFPGVFRVLSELIKIKISFINSL